MSSTVPLKHCKHKKACRRCGADMARGWTVCRACGAGYCFGESIPSEANRTEHGTVVRQRTKKP